MATRRTGLKGDKNQSASVPENLQNNRYNTSLEYIGFHPCLLPENNPSLLPCLAAAASFIAAARRRRPTSRKMLFTKLAATKLLTAIFHIVF